MNFKILSIFLLINLVACSDDNPPNPIDSGIDQISLNSSLDYKLLVESIDEDFLLLTTESPDSQGALGRNKNGYFHARFQMDFSKIMDLALIKKDNSLMTTYYKAFSYPFDFQTAAGDFSFVPPQELLNSPGYTTPSSGDLASATAFFAYGLGVGLHHAELSDWFQQDTNTEGIRDLIISYDDQISALLTYLMNQKSVLLSYDQHAPNRLFFDAIAFYTLGTYLNDDQAINTAITFAENALKQRDETDGYFIEGGGWDSSYNGVAIKLGFELFTMLEENSKLKNDLESALIKATEWQKSRILTTGEISTEGNTRVYPGGENFVGTEKEVDVEKTIRAFYYMSFLSQNEEYNLLGDKILDFYN